MSERDAFLKRLAEDEDDTATRVVFADWLDERGEHEEADRQRKWPVAKAWIERVCKMCSGEYQQVRYEELIEFGHQVVRDENPRDRYYLPNDDVWSELRFNRDEFWTNWSIVTGVALPPGLEAKGFHYWACCSHEVYYWFGAPDEEEEET